ncbi:probable BOI-related E3 ubiquitin-protein ligase 2 isoform X1 [Cucurbita maxima]|uniref:Probable BOI-related E3 ubiquitin-protein ligase 2 isoform X1 n=1 Tax=Cucurbita maxima TaxID=3661 RepID=A0A6J1IEH6_CUCMA|nr:probable BOI-related E3 ubiquitin-protein ligase 2 isoform X1 [Cucurbita maxima]
MALPQNHYQQHYQSQQQHQSISFRNLYTAEGHVSQPISYFNPFNLQEHSQHPPYVPPCTAPGQDASDGVADFHWMHGIEPKKKRLKEQDLFENNSQISSIDFLQPRPVSTGLGLSLDNTRMASTGDSPLVSLIGDDIDLELQRQDEDIEKFLHVQGERLRRTILEKIQANQLQTLLTVEERIIKKLREKEAEVECINKKNIELEQRMEQLSVEAGAWQQRARYNENMITALKFNLQQVYAQSRDSKEGCGDSEVEDTASCCNGRSLDFQLLRGNSNDMKDLMYCKACRVNEVCMLLLPCKHLCLCKDCESRLSFCPLCQSSKFIGMEVYM